MKLIWSAFALSDRDSIFTHIETDHPKAAIAVDERIVAAIRRLVEFPECGRPGRHCRDPRTRHRRHPIHRGLCGDENFGSDPTHPSWRRAMA